MWILGHLREEILFFFLPGILSVLVATLFPHLGEVSLVYAFIATAFIDSGHVYTTLWRTYFHPQELRTHRAYVIAPVFFFILFTAWFYLRLPYLWSFIVYATLYHHIRQYYGFSKWYQSLNRRTDKISDYYLYTLAALPMVIYHFRSDAIAGYYSERDLFILPHPLLESFFLVVYAIVVASWVVRERRLWNDGIREMNRVFSIIFPATIYAYCFLYGRTLTQVLFPLLFVHGISYFGVMKQTLQRTQGQRFTTGWTTLLIVLATALLLGGTESWVEESRQDFILGEPLWLSSIIVGLTLTPLFCHYVFDALIWRRNHWEAKKTYDRE